MAEHKDYNIMSEHGVTDIDYVEEFQMPMALVGTPAVNDFMISYVYDQNVMSATKEYMDSGMDTRLAATKAHKEAGEHKKIALQQLHKVIKRRGY